jgi:hypothetical protein
MFNQATRQSHIQLQPVAYSSGAVVSQQLPPVGFLSKIVVPFSINLTTAAAGANAYPLGLPCTPYNLFQRIRVLTNEGAEIYNTSGTGNYLLQRSMRGGYDIRNPLTSYSSSNTALAISSLPAISGNSQTVTISGSLMLPISWQEANLAGLILLQNPTTRLQLEFTFANAASGTSGLIYNSTAQTSTINSVTISPMMEIYNLPASASDYPDLSNVHVVLEDTTPITATGDFVYRPTLGNIYLNIIQSFRNNVVNGSLNNQFLPTDFTQLRLNYAQTQQAYNYTPAQKLVMQRYYGSGIDMPDGVFWWDFVFGSGLLEIGNTRDVIDTARLTDLAVVTSISSASTNTPGTCYTIREMLAPIAR